MEVLKEESEKVGLKLNTQKTKIIASGPITLWQIDRETIETEILFSWVSKSMQTVTAGMKSKDACLLLGGKAMKNLGSICKKRDITLPTDRAKAMVFPVVA